MAEDQERTEDRERLEKLMSRLESYLLSLEQMRLREYIHFLGDRKRLMRSHFWGGVARGLGMAVGFTILGAMLLSCSRFVATEFSFFMAIPTMLGASAIKGLKFLLSGVAATGTEIGVLIVGCVVSFVVSLLVIRGLMEYVRRHSFSAFGVYRIILGVVVLVYFAMAG